MSTDPSTGTLYIPIDMGKNVHWVAAYAGPTLTAVAAPHKVRNTQPGYDAFWAWLQPYLTAARWPRLVVGHEPTGIYYESWAYALQRDRPAHLVHHLLHPQSVQRRRQELLKGRARKSDALDLWAMAHCLRDGVGQPYFVPDGPALAFTVWQQQYRQLMQHKQRVVRQLHSQMDRLWPGALLNRAHFATMHPELALPTPLVRTRPFERQVLAALLTTNANPYHWRACSVDQIAQQLRTRQVRCGPATAQHIQQVVQRALLPPPHVAALLAPRLAATFARFQLLLRQLTQLRTQCAAVVPDSSAAVLTTVPGISPFLAACYLAHLGAPDRFDRPAQAWAFWGLAPVTRSSGDQVVVGPLSKKGAPAARATLFQIGQHTVRHCPPIQLCYQRARQRGKAYTPAIIHAAHKAHRLLFRLLRDQVPYDPQHR